MHELSLCDDLLRQVSALARQHQAVGVARIHLHIGLLAGVEPRLLDSAFQIARLGTLAERAQLLTVTIPPRVSCNTCGAESDTPPNQLSCPHCGSDNTHLIRGNELILARVELEVQ